MKIQDFKDSILYGLLPGIEEIVIEYAYNEHDFNIFIEGNKVILKTNRNFTEGR